MEENEGEREAGKEEGDERGEKRENIRLYKFSRDLGEFTEIHDDEIPEDGIKELLHAEPSSSFALFQMDKYMVWLYHGSETSTQVKFMSARGITRLRDEILLGGKVMTVDEGSEPLPFQFATKMADPADHGVEEIDPSTFKPAYTGTKEDESYLLQLSLENITLLMEQIPTPADLEREAVIHDNQLFAVKNVRRRLFGSEMEEIELVPMPENVEIESGTYLAKDLLPRLYFENNKLVMIELLRKVTRREKTVTFFDNKMG
ncbi:MAG: hypothetical protein ACTSUE_19745 [Promethearchaeota archaeon]